MIQTATSLNSNAATQAWKVVRAWPGLSAEAKLAWSYLLELTLGRVETTIEVSIASIGEKYGAGDATRSGRRSVEAMRDKGLVTIVDKAPGGIWTLHLHDPIPARKARLLPADPQRHLFDDLPAEEQAVVAQPPPEQGKTTPTPNTSICARAEQPQKQRGAGGGCATTADELDARSAFDVPILRIQQRVTEQPIEAAALARRIFETVQDPNLSKNLCDRVAWAVVEGAYPSVRLERIIRSAAARPTAQRRGSYFVHSIKKSFDEVGVPLDRRRSASSQSGERHESS